MADDSAVTPVAPVTPAIMQDYLKVEADESVLQDLITTSEIETQNAINSDIPLTVYRTYSVFNQAVKTLVDFLYFSRGDQSDQKVAYPLSYQFLLNNLRWKVLND
ncbi:head-tail connector protein [Oenococcus oeni]|nr:head-tail connector protein [Oenococcus oeni]EJN93117.1 DNA packaging protein [Oenococcus oeni AWRIB304]EJO07152.1 DNA packaging, phage associated protein [Oenococcus oeni AWRIB422]KGH55226.1 DNA packaging-like protein [Oenococcus oeni S22]KGH57006.1 DNA packaging-like protein [Oenococcus oeni IOEB_B10]KGH59741.1 DNA packaging-like protein [Oenococcus oeni S28]